MLCRILYLACIIAFTKRSGANALPSAKMLHGLHVVVKAAILRSIFAEGTTIVIAYVQ